MTLGGSDHRISENNVDNPRSHKQIAHLTQIMENKEKSNHESQVIRAVQSRVMGKKKGQSRKSTLLQKYPPQA